MSGRKHLITFGSAPEAEPEASVDAQVEDLAPEAKEPETEDRWEDFAEVTESHRGRMAPALAIIAIAGWSTFFAYANIAQFSTAGPQQWIGWITSWSIPVLLIVALWLLAMRHSRKEAVRFGEIARSLSVESERLEMRLTTVNRELSLAREFIAAQSRDLESLGRVASDRISQSAERLSVLVHENGDRIEQIAGVSTTALENMNRLRSELPVIANSARDMSNQIGGAGQKANSQLDELVSGFSRLNDFGEASHRQVEGLQEKVELAIASFEQQAAQLERLVGERFTLLTSQSESYSADLDAMEAAAISTISRRANALSNELELARKSLQEAEELGLAGLRERTSALAYDGRRVSDELRANEEEASRQWREAVDRLQDHMRNAISRIAEIDAGAMENARKRLASLQEEAVRVDETMAERTRVFYESIAQRREAEQARQSKLELELEDRLAALDVRISERQEEHLAHMAGLDERGEVLGSRISRLGEKMALVSSQSREATDSLSASIERLATLLKESDGALQGTDQAVAGLTDASIRLLEIIQAGASQSKQELPEAITAAEERLAGIERRASALGQLMEDASEKGQSLSDYVLDADKNAQSALINLEVLQQKVGDNSDDHLAQINTLKAALTSLSEASDQLSDKAQNTLRGAITALQDAARGVVEELGTNSADTVKELADRLANESGEALDRAIRTRTAESINDLEKAAAAATGATGKAAIELRDQMAQVTDLANNLEARVAQAREKAQENVDNDFSRRMALISESLNSNSIDIAKALSNDVSDTAWASYLRGDRGIFTRRAVRLLENSEAREIAELYDVDRDFREHVSRYIHDFESMLRTMLSTRDGNVLAVTLLSADMGKLYVALAQAIERLRD